MVKAVFIDYMGTTVEERSPEMAEIIRRICKNSSVHDPKQVQRSILDTRRSYEANSLPHGDGCLHGMDQSEGSMLHCVKVSFIQGCTSPGNAI